MCQFHAPPPLLIHSNFFCVYPTLLNDSMTVSDELEREWADYVSHGSAIRLEGPGNIRKSPSQNCWCPDQRSNCAHPS
jgi:hypothetical protein